MRKTARHVQRPRRSLNAAQNIIRALPPRLNVTNTMAVTLRYRFLRKLYEFEARNCRNAFANVVTIVCFSSVFFLKKRRNLLRKFVIENVRRCFDKGTPTRTVISTDAVVRKRTLPSSNFERTEKRKLRPTISKRVRILFEYILYAITSTSPSNRLVAERLEDQENVYLHVRDTMFGVELSNVSDNYLSGL